MEQKELYPKLIDYIFDYCGKYFWENEIKAHKHLHAFAKSDKGVNTRVYKFFMKEENIYQNQEVLDLVSGGFNSFKIKVATRIFNEHKHELELNLARNVAKSQGRHTLNSVNFVFIAGIVFNER